MSHREPLAFMKNVFMGKYVNGYGNIGTGLRPFLPSLGVWDESRKCSQGALQ